MITIFISLILLHCSKGTAGDSGVVQEPFLWKVKESSAVLSCTHNKGAAYYVMYWYRQRPGETIRLTVITTAQREPDFGEVDKDKFEPDKRNAESGCLMVKDLEPEDTAIYFCSVSQHSVLAGGWRVLYKIILYMKDQH
ncbi:hypothetical protein ABG768_010085 [Culter alburnus]|uniref:Ig-like domain-containing protein n=1 Tax=Culter alburnus TaxID=194366 RepID=A0AAW1ZI21_CULAL